MINTIKTGMTDKGVVLKVPKKDMSRRRFIGLLTKGALGAAVGYGTYKICDEPVDGFVDSAYEFMGWNPITEGTVISSNRNLDYTKDNLEILKDMGIKDVYAKEFERKKGDIWYQTIVGTTDRKHEKSLDKIVNSEHFKGTEPFEITEEELKQLTEETRSERKERMKKMEDDFKERMEKINKKEEFADLYSPTMQRRHKLYYGKNLPAEKAKEVAGYIFEAAKEFNIPKVEYLSLISHESKFKNKLGDLKFKSKGTHSEGYIQMRIPTQKWVLKKMQREGIKGLPKLIPYVDKNLPKDERSLLNFPKLQLRMGAWFFKYCLEDSGWDGKSVIIPEETLEKSISKYNTGPNTDWINNEYVDKVNKEKEIFETSTT